MKYFVDSAMLGDGSNEELEEFCLVLQSLTDVPIYPVYESYNGADNSFYEGEEVPWDAAMDIYASRKFLYRGE
jgi:hypothetical protein